MNLAGDPLKQAMVYQNPQHQYSVGDKGFIMKLAGDLTFGKGEASLISPVYHPFSLNSKDEDKREDKKTEKKHEICTWQAGPIRSGCSTIAVNSILSCRITNAWEITENFCLRMNNNRKKADNFVDGVREHVRLGLKFSETVKGKLSLGLGFFNLGE
ncbi:hypothetical protein CK203_084041 [Vitis vinifera]|uniref:Uncharacterized protein n=1 Tax=Vitis vinifera TaxID=29760 RepID=A0A438EUU2_VITVI|nr:hypothetical protein CK203_084041 [Vitis vinifera]